MASTKTAPNLLDKITKRMRSLAASAFIWMTLAKVLQNIKRYFSELSQNEGTYSLKKESNQILTNLRITGAILYQTIYPVLKTIMSVVSEITAGVAKFASILFNIDINSSKKLADNTESIAENVEKATAGFDTLQTAIANTANSSGFDTNMDTSSIDDLLQNGTVDKYESWANKLKKSFKELTEDINWEPLKNGLGAVKKP
ncbi:MAG: hypothetical protein HFE78_08550 [Clostridiales bacterium]|nr:hypothetical protein [Clostridiales bacterium]